MHKFVTISSKNKSVVPYLNTTVLFDKTFVEIQSLLMKFGCSDLMTRQVAGTVPQTSLPCTLYTIAFFHRGQKFLIEFPIIIALVGRDRRDKKVMMNVSGRLMLNKIKALLVDVELDVMTFEQAMMPFQLISDGAGKPVTIQEYVDTNRDKIQSGNMGSLFALGP